MVDAESILDSIPSKQKRWIPKLGDINGANRFESCPDFILVFDTALPLGTAIRQNRIQGRYDSLERQAT